MDAAETTRLIESVIKMREFQRLAKEDYISDEAKRDMEGRAEFLEAIVDEKLTQVIAR